METGGEQSQLIPSTGFREDFLVGTSTYTGDDSSAGIVITNRRWRRAPLHKTDLTPKDMEHRRGKADEREQGKGLVWAMQQVQGGGRS